MNRSLFIFASAESRLHADLIIVRLHHAGISTSAMSLLHPFALTPSSALCWLRESREIALGPGQNVAVSGALAGRPVTGDTATLSLVQELTALGLASDQSANVREILTEGRIVVVIESRDRDEVRDILELLRFLAVENVIMASRHADAKLAA